MLPEMTRPSLNRSALVGLLAELALLDRPATPPSFVEGLSQWLGWKEAIPLSTALQAPLYGAALQAPVSATSLQVPPTTTAAIDFSRVRQALERAISDPSSTALEDGASFVPFRRRYFGLQQAMENAIGPLRTRLRVAVAQQPSPPLARLAVLDAAMAEALASREQGLLAVMPVLLEKHFTTLRQTALEAQRTQQPAAPQPQPAWLPRFCHDMQRLLLAELDLRLQPAQGLLDTLQAARPDPLVS